MSAWYQLSEQQEYQLAQARDALSAIASLVENLPDDRRIQLSRDEAIALVNLLQAAIPAADELAFVVE